MRSYTQVWLADLPGFARVPRVRFAWSWFARGLCSRRPGADRCPRELRRVTTTGMGKKILLDSSYGLDNKNCR
jgi:hypothetical protein